METVPLPEPVVVKKRPIDAVVIDEIASNDQPSTSKKEECQGTKTPVVSQVRSPQYKLYQDSDIDTAAKSGSIPVELRHRIIRGTIHNMISTALNSLWNRLPTTNEVMEMAKSLVIAYPLLSDPVTQLIKLINNSVGKHKRNTCLMSVCIH